MSETNRGTERTRAARADVPNAGRASNDQAPHSGAVAEQLNRAAEDRRLSTALTHGTPGPSAEKDRSRLRTEMARDAMQPGGGVRNAARENEHARHIGRTWATRDYTAERAAAAEKAAARRTPGPDATARTEEVQKIARASRVDERAIRAEAAKPMTAADYWSAKVARGAGQSEGAQAQARGQKDGARRGMSQGVG